MIAAPVVIVGAGGFGREAADVVIACGRPVLGVVDDSPATRNLDRLRDRGIPHLGSLRDLLTTGPGDAQIIIGIGDPAIRSRLGGVLAEAGFEFATLVHPRATIGSSVRMGPGTVICAGACVSTNVTLGRHVHLNPNCTIGHDTVIDDFASVNPAATVGGEVRVGARTLLGSAANVLQGLTIGTDSLIGASSLVTRHVPDQVVVKGIPGRW